MNWSHRGRFVHNHNVMPTASRSMLIPDIPCGVAEVWDHFNHFFHIEEEKKKKKKTVKKKK